jgi:hypothetical protein
MLGGSRWGVRIDIAGCRGGGRAVKAGLGEGGWRGGGCGWAIDRRGGGLGAATLYDGLHEGTVM